MPEALVWWHDSWVGELLRGNLVLFVVVQSLHFLGVCLLFGALLIVDLRILGFAPFISLRTALKFVPWAFVGLVIQVFSGLGFFAAYGYNYWSNPMVGIKLTLVALGAINAAWFFFDPRFRTIDEAGSAFGPIGKSSAAVSLMTWLLVLMASRLIPVFERADFFSVFRNAFQGI